MRNPNARNHYALKGVYNYAYKGVYNYASTGVLLYALIGGSMKLKKRNLQRVQVFLDDEQLDQLAQITKYTGMNKSEILRSILDNQKENLAIAISQARRDTNQGDLYEPPPEPKKEPKPEPTTAPKKTTPKKPSEKKPITNDSFAALIKKQKEK